MSFFESLSIALFCITVVFSVLVILWGLVRLFSAFIQFIESRREQTPPAGGRKA